MLSRLILPAVPPANIRNECRRLGAATLYWLVLGACQPSPHARVPATPEATMPQSVQSPVPVPPPTPAAAAENVALALPDVERARIEYALDSAKLIAQDWPWLRADATCALLIAPKLQWVVNCATPPDSFQAVGAPLLGKPVYAHAGDSISMGGQAIPTAAFIAAMPATADVPLPKETTTALTPDTPWIIASSLDGLIGVHPAFGTDTSTEEWLSVFLHEFFHTRRSGARSMKSGVPSLKNVGENPWCALTSRSRTSKARPATSRPSSWATLAFIHLCLFEPTPISRTIGPSL